ncbi:MAG: hypothetical protein JNJ54_31640 [Myxococcaceae bacterium]|nr:hypothetical protein [Myxococcaceae bacterium]
MFKRDEAGPSGGHWTPAEARAVLARWAASGLTKTAFAEQEGLSTERLRRWERRLEQADGSDELKVKLVPLIAREVPATTTGASARLQLPGGVVLEFDAGRVDPSWVAALVLDVTRACRCCCCRGRYTCTSPPRRAT